MWDVVGRHRCRLTSDTLYPRDDRRREVLSEKVEYSHYASWSVSTMSEVGQLWCSLPRDWFLQYIVPRSALRSRMRDAGFPARLHWRQLDENLSHFFSSSLVSTFAFALPLNHFW